MLTDNYILI